MVAPVRSARATLPEPAPDEGLLSAGGVHHRHRLRPTHRHAPHAVADADGGVAGLRPGEDDQHLGVGRGLDFELFRPGQTNVREYYAELPIAVKLAGKYHDLGAFASDIANLPRIVTLNNLNLTTGRAGNLTLDATAKTYRYLDPEELAAQRKAKEPAKGSAK